jgi:hypothetical protein
MFDPALTRSAVASPALRLAFGSSGVTLLAECSPPQRLKPVAFRSGAAPFDFAQGRLLKACPDTDRIALFQVFGADEDAPFQGNVNGDGQECPSHTVLFWEWGGVGRWNFVDFDFY